MGAPNGDFAVFLAEAQQQRFAPWIATVDADDGRRLPLSGAPWLLQSSELLSSCSTSCGGSSSPRSFLSWLLAFNVLNTGSAGVREFIVALDRLTGADLSPDPAPASRFRRNRFLTAGHPAS